MKSIIKFIEGVGLCVTFNVVIIAELQHFFYILNRAYDASCSGSLVSNHVFHVDFELGVLRGNTQHHVNSLTRSQSLIRLINLLVINEKSINN